MVKKWSKNDGKQKHKENTRSKAIGRIAGTKMIRTKKNTRFDATERIAGSKMIRKK